MKLTRYLLISIVFLSLSGLIAQGRSEQEVSYKILTLTPPKARIGERLIQKGDTFFEHDINSIVWVDRGQTMTTKNLRTGAKRYFTPSLVKEHNALHSIKDFYYNTSHGSTAKNFRTRQSYLGSYMASMALLPDYLPRRCAIVIDEYGKSDSVNVENALLHLGFDLLDISDSIMAGSLHYDVLFIYYAGEIDQKYSEMGTLLKKSHIGTKIGIFNIFNSAKFIADSLGDDNKTNAAILTLDNRTGHTSHNIEFANQLIRLISLPNKSAQETLNEMAVFLTPDSLLNTTLSGKMRRDFKFSLSRPVKRIRPPRPDTLVSNKFSLPPYIDSRCTLSTSIPEISVALDSVNPTTLYIWNNTPSYLVLGLTRKVADYILNTDSVYAKFDPDNLIAGSRSNSVALPPGGIPVKLEFDYVFHRNKSNGDVWLNGMRIPMMLSGEIDIPQIFDLDINYTKPISHPVSVESLISKEFREAVPTVSSGKFLSIDNISAHRTTVGVRVDFSIRNNDSEPMKIETPFFATESSAFGFNGIRYIPTNLTYPSEKIKVGASAKFSFLLRNYQTDIDFIPLIYIEINESLQDSRSKREILGVWDLPITDD